MKRTYSLPWLVAAALALTLPLAAVAADEAPTAPQTPEAAVSAEAPAPASGSISMLKVGKDPKTGKLRKPTEAQDLQMALQMQEFWLSFPRHEAKVNKRTKEASLVVAPHFITTAVATKSADGRLVWDCADSPSQIPDVLERLREQGAGPEER